MQSTDAKIVVLDREMMLNPIFPFKVMYTHSEIEEFPNGDKVENLFFSPTARMIGEETTTQILGKAEWYKDSNVFLAHSHEYEKYRVYKFSLVESQTARWQYQQINSCYTHINTLAVEMIGFAIKHGGNLGFISLADQYKPAFKKIKIKQDYYDSVAHTHKVKEVDFFLCEVTTFYDHLQEVREHEGAL